MYIFLGSLVWKISTVFSHSSNSSFFHSIHPTLIILCISLNISRHLGAWMRYTNRDPHSHHDEHEHTCNTIRAFGHGRTETHPIHPSFPTKKESFFSFWVILKLIIIILLLTKSTTQVCFFLVVPFITFSLGLKSRSLPPPYQPVVLFCNAV